MPDLNTRWTMIVEFDLPDKTWLDMDEGKSESELFISYLYERFGLDEADPGEREDFEEQVDLQFDAECERFIIQAESIDHLKGVHDWLIMHTIPQLVSIKRNGER